MRDDAVPAATVTEQTATLLWEACRRNPDPASLRRALAGGADIGWAVSAAAEQRIGPLLWRALGAAGSLDALGSDGAALRGMADAFRMEALLLLPRAVALAVRPLTDAGLEPVVLRGPRWQPATPSPACGQWTTSTCYCPRRSPARPRRTGPRRMAGDPPRSRRPLRHRADPRRGALVLPGGALRAGARVATGDGARPRQVVGHAPAAEYGHVGIRVAPAEELVVLAAHAGKPHHRFVRLVWMADLAMIVGAAGRTAPTSTGTVCAPWPGGSVRDRGGRRPGDGPPGRPGRAGRSFPLPTGGRRGDAMRRLFSVTWPLTNLELPGWRLRYALTDSRPQRVKVLLADFALGHGIRARARRVVGLPPRVVRSRSIRRPPEARRY